MILALTLAIVVGSVGFALGALLLVAVILTLSNWKQVYRNDKVHYLYRKVVIVILPLLLVLATLTYGVLK
jgi:hypothetical protein